MAIIPATRIHSEFSLAGFWDVLDDHECSGGLQIKVCLGSSILLDELAKSQ